MFCSGKGFIDSYFVGAKDVMIKTSGKIAPLGSVRTTAADRQDWFFWRPQINGELRWLSFNPFEKMDHFPPI